MIETDQADHSGTKLDHDLIVPITNCSRLKILAEREVMNKNLQVER